MLIKSTIIPIVVVSLQAQISQAIAFAEAYSHGDPLAFAEANGFAVGEASDATYECHASCGYAILAARACSPNGSTDGDYKSSCLCSSSGQFVSLVSDCLNCGWCLWSDYGSYLTSALGECSYATTPTGTQCLDNKTSWLLDEKSATAGSNSNSAAGNSYASKYATDSAAYPSAIVGATTTSSVSKRVVTVTASDSPSTSSESISTAYDSVSSSGVASGKHAIGICSVFLALCAILI